MRPDKSSYRLVDKHCPLHPTVEMIEHVISTDPPQYRYVCPVCSRRPEKEEAK